MSQTTIFHGTYEKAHLLETDFAIHESILHTIKDFRVINPKISTLTLKTDNFNMLLINAH